LIAEHGKLSSLERLRTSLSQKKHLLSLLLAKQSWHTARAAWCEEGIEGISKFAGDSPWEHRVSTGLAGTSAVARSAYESLLQAVCHFLTELACQMSFVSSSLLQASDYAQSCLEME
jgi:hypothetical protein